MQVNMSDLGQVDRVDENVQGAAEPNRSVAISKALTAVAHLFRYESTAVMRAARAWLPTYRVW
jgi:hypothetical protein